MLLRMVGLSLTDVLWCIYCLCIEIDLKLSTFRLLCGICLQTNLFLWKPRSV